MKYQFILVIIKMNQKQMLKMRHRTWRIPKSSVLECRTTFPVHDVLRPKAYNNVMRSIFAQMRRMCPDFFVLEKNLDRGAIATKLVPGVIR
jgi:hypothetical protein